MGRFFDPGTGSILLNNVACSGTETRLVDCQSSGIENNDCGHSEDAGITCEPPGTTGKVTPKTCSSLLFRG